MKLPGNVRFYVDFELTSYRLNSEKSLVTLVLLRPITSIFGTPEELQVCSLPLCPGHIGSDSDKSLLVCLVC